MTVMVPVVTVTMVLRMGRHNRADKDSKSKEREQDFLHVRFSRWCTFGEC
jgi:hypothetical protein